MNKVLEKLELTHPGLVYAFMDDIILGVKDSDNVDDILLEAKELLETIHLELNVDKCKCTRNGDTIDYMGI